MLKKMMLMSLLVVGASLLILSNSTTVMKIGGIIMIAGTLYGAFELLFRNSVELLSGSKITKKDLKNLPLEIQRKYRKITIVVGIICLIVSVLCLYGISYKL